MCNTLINLEQIATVTTDGDNEEEYFKELIDNYRDDVVEPEGNNQFKIYSIKKLQTR